MQQENTSLKCNIPLLWEEGEWEDSDKIVESTSFSIENILLQSGKIDFKALIRFLEGETEWVYISFNEEIVEKIFFPFFDDLKQKYFSENIAFPDNILSLLRNHPSVRNAIITYIEKKNDQIKPHIDQYDSIDFHLFLLWMNQDFDLVKDIYIDYFKNINTLFADSTAKVLKIIGNIPGWTSKNLSEQLAQELNYCMQLGETINKLALIHMGNFEESQISFELGIIIRTNINNLRRQLHPEIIRNHIIWKKLSNLSWKVQGNFAHKALIGGTISQINEIDAHIHEEQIEWLAIQEEVDFWQENKNGENYRKEKEISEIVGLWNNALRQLISISEIGKIQKYDSPELRAKKMKPLKDIIYIYNYAGNKKLEGIEEIFVDINCNGIQNEFQIEALHYLILYSDDIKESSLEKLMSFFLSNQNQSNKLFYEKYEEWGTKIIALIIRRFRSRIQPLQYLQFLPLVEQMYASLKEKEVSHSVLNYSKLYLSLALFYIECSNKEYVENAQICFSRYRDLSAGFTDINKNSNNIWDEKDFLIALGYLDEINRYGKSVHTNEELERSWEFVFQKTMERFQRNSVLSIKSELEEIIASMNLWGDILMQDGINSLLGEKIAKVLFYNLCTIKVLGDCKSCKRNDVSHNRTECKSCRISSIIKMEKCPVAFWRRGFQKKSIPLDWGVFITISYPSVVERIIDKIFSTQKDLIKISFWNLITINHNNTLLQQSRTNLERLAFYDVLTDLPNKTQLLNDIKKMETVDKWALLLLKFDQVTDISDGFGFDEWDILIKKIAEMLKALELGNIYRTGWPEFGIIIDDSMRWGGIEMIAKHLIDKIMKISVGSDENGIAYVTPTIGIVKLDGTRTYDKAHTALREAWRKGIGQYQIYEDGIAETRIQRELFVQNTLNTSLKNREVTAYFQLIRDNRNPNNPRKKYESLMRVLWLSPGEFIEVAKKHGLLPELTREVLEKTFQIAQTNENQYSVNVTEENLRDIDFISNFQELLEENNINASRICIEITEDVINIDAGYIQKLVELDEMGCEFSIDDFGVKNSGWERITQLKKHLKNFRYIKIDGLFIKDIDTNISHYSIVEGITHTAHKLGLKVVAEFVSSEAIQEKIDELEIDYSQGFQWTETT